MDAADGSARAPVADGGRSGVAALVLVQLLFGLHYSVAREITAQIDPLAWTALRALLAVVALAVVMVVLRRAWPRGGALWARLTLLGALGVALNQLLFNAGMARSTAIHAVLLMATVPAQTLALGVLMGQERFTARKLASVLLGLVGVAILLRVDALAGSGSGAWWQTRDGGEAASFGATLLAGDLMIFANASCYALYLALGKATTRRLDPVALCAGVYVTGGALALALGGTALARVDLAGLPGALWGWIGFVVLGPTVAGYLLNLHALARLPTSTVGLFINLQFLIAAGVAMWWHGERFDARLVLAGLLVLGGLALRVRAEPVPKDR